MPDEGEQASAGEDELEALPIYQPEEPRPRGFVAGSLFDLTALLHVTTALLRAAGMPAFLSLAAVVITLWLLGAVTGLMVALTGVFPCGFIALGILAIVTPALIPGAPLTAFAMAATGMKPRFRDACNRAFDRVHWLAWIEGRIAGFLVLGAAPMILWLHHARDLPAITSVIALLASLAAALGAPYTALRTLALGPVMAVVEGTMSERTLKRNIPLTRGREVMLSVVVLVPLAIVAAASPAPALASIVEDAIGSSGRALMFFGAVLLGASLAILVGSALLVAAWAVILGSPVSRAP